jgi:hypothetical protein
VPAVSACFTITIMNAACFAAMPSLQRDSAIGCIRRRLMESSQGGRRTGGDDGRASA